MKAQRRLYTTRRPEPDLQARWAEIAIADPVKYPGLTQILAAKMLHRLNKPHPPERCELCDPRKEL